MCLVLTMLAFHVLAQNYLPREVQRFIDRRESCDRIRVELQNIDEANREHRKLCGGLDNELTRLKKKYATNSTIIQILNQFDDGFEAANR
jgi:Fic family protein